MHLTRLNIERIRNLETVVLSNLQPFNVFYGKNGSGKTSVLEAVHLLATGRSFRTHIPNYYIQNNRKDTLIFAQAGSDRIGIQKFTSGEQFIRVNGDTVATQGQLAKFLPLHHIDPLSTDIIDHGAKPRRQLLDWLMFHVEPDFYVTWQYYAKTLKQRNILLKKRTKATFRDIEPWDKMLAQYGELLHSQRLGILEQWKIFFQIELEQLLPELNISLDYFAGFHAEKGLWSDLTEHRTQDIERKHTQYGPHRADLKLKTPLGHADVVLSRGQKKLLVIALKLSQIAMLHASNKETVVLLDDLTAELDLTAQQRLIQRLSQLGSQVFLTTLDRDVVEQHLKDLEIIYQLFRVDSGQVQAVEV